MKVNGEVSIIPYYVVQEKDIVEYEGRVIQPEEDKVYLLMNKPKNTITTLDDERDRKTVMHILKPEDKKLRIFPVGRLDRDTTGLLLLTNDGELAAKLTHPRHKVKKIYHAVLDRDLDKEDLFRIRHGLTLEDGPVVVDKISYVNDARPNEIGLEIHLGRNRIVRRIFEHVGYKVVKLDRVYFAGLTKKDIPRGRYRTLKDKEVIMLKHFI